jgi:hypothetical protein
MNESIYMRVGERNVIDLPEFWRATGNFLGLLEEVDSSVANKKSGNIRWQLTTLQDSPAPLIGVTPRLANRRVVLDTREAVQREIIGNIVSLNERGERNKYLSDAALTRVEKLAKATPKVGASVIYTSPDAAVNLTTTVSVKTLTQVQELTNPRSVSFGTIAGSLDAISVHNGLEFRVWDDDTKRPVRCYLHPDQKKHAMDLLGARVLVMGMVKADRYGRPISMNVETFDSASIPTNLPTIEEMRGAVPDVTGGLSLKEFLEDFD